jgi:hypothetical protein
MKHPNKLLTAALLIAGCNLISMTGCVGGGYVEASSGPGYYGDGPYIDNTVIVGGRGWYGGHRDNVYVHPDNHPAPRRDVHVDVRASSGGHDGHNGNDGHDDHHH